MPERPSLLDNRGADTSHGGGLTYLARDERIDYGLSVATGYVNLGGLRHLAAEVGAHRRTRLLLGAAPEAGLGKELPATLFERTLATLRSERDLARFPPSRALRELLEIRGWLDCGDVEVRRYTKQFLHGKAYLFGNQDDARAALVTSANLTAAGMWRNLELGLVHYDPHVARRALEWFDELWNDAADYKESLHELLFPEVTLLSPRDVYLKALLELLGDDTDEDARPEAVQLAAFQREGFERALGVVRKRRGVVYADGVGTGKTEVGLAFVEEYAVRRGQHALIVAPAQLVTQWEERLHQTRLPAQVVSYSRFASDEQLADSEREPKRRVLSNAKDAYRLIIFDEAHTLRNPGTTWYRAMSRLLGGPPKDLVLLSATPINNGLWDLYHLVMAFARHDGAFAADGIGSLRKLFVRAGANARDPEGLDPDVLFPLAAMVSVRRDRRFIETHYPGASFPDGTPVRFPTPRLSTERYDLDAEYPGLVGAMTDRIGALSMARYRPSSYRLGVAEEHREVVLGALLQSAVLKRFESCWYACLLTIRRMLSAHEAFLEAWERGHVLSKDALREAATAELDETAMGQWLDETLEDEELTESTDRYRPEYAQDVRSDRARLKEIEALLEGLDAGSDPKLRLLRGLLDESPSQKVVVFSTFADTIRYLGEHLQERASGRDRVEVIGAETSPDERTELVARFCPDTVVRPGYEPPEGEVDLLLSNDVLSEGQNLQQAAAVISYDMPWNPQRVVQRYGRVIRLKSPHREVHLSTMLPEPGDLEAILGLEITIRRKIVAAGPYGMEVEVLDPARDETTSDVRSYARRLAEGDSTLLDEQDGAAGELGLSADALRAELRRAVAEGEVERLRKLPWGVGAAFRQGPGVPSRGAPGVFFACRVGESPGDSWSYWRYVSGEQVLSEPARILRRIDPGDAAGIAEPEVDIESAWELAVASIVAEHNKDVGRPASDSIGPVQRWALGVLADPAAGRPDGSEGAWDALQVGRSQPERKALGEIKRLLEREEIASTEAARRIVDVTRSYGLRPVDLPAEKKPIEESDVGVVCWMAVL